MSMHSSRNRDIASSSILFPQTLDLRAGLGSDNAPNPNGEDRGDEV